MARLLHKLATQILKTMKHKIFFILILAGVVGCSDDRVERLDYGSVDFPGEKGALIAKQWKLDGYETGKSPFSSIIEFKSQRNPKGEGYILSGRSAVNFYEANYVLSGTNSIKVHSLSVTEIAGNEAEGSFEKDFFRRVSAVENYTIGKNELLLSNSKGMTMRFISTN